MNREKNVNNTDLSNSDSTSSGDISDPRMLMDTDEIPSKLDNRYLLANFLDEKINNDRKVFYAAFRDLADNLSYDQLEDFLSSFIVNAKAVLVRKEGDILRLPSKPPRKFIKEKSGDPVKFLQRTYQIWLDRKTITQADLRKIDPDLMRALDGKFNRRRDDLSAIIPTRIRKNTDRLAAALPIDMEVSGPARANALKAIKLLNNG